LENSGEMLNKKASFERKRKMTKEVNHKQPEKNFVEFSFTHGDGKIATKKRLWSGKYHKRIKTP
jgi:hypothetical protein